MSTQWIEFPEWKSHHQSLFSLRIKLMTIEESQQSSSKCPIEVAGMAFRPY